MNPTGGFDSEYWEAVWDDVPIPQEYVPEAIPELHRMFWSVLPKGPLSFIEVGCAPGKWMLRPSSRKHWLRRRRKGR